MEVDDGGIQRREHLCERYGDTSVAVFRRIYGSHFVPHCRDDEKLKDVFDKLDVESLTNLMLDEKEGNLSRLIVKFGQGR